MARGPRFRDSPTISRSRAGSIHYEKKHFDFRRVQSTGGFIDPTEGDLSATQSEAGQTPDPASDPDLPHREDASAYASKYARGFKAGHFNRWPPESLGPVRRTRSTPTRGRRACAGRGSITGSPLATSFF